MRPAFCLVYALSAAVWTPLALADAELTGDDRPVDLREVEHHRSVSLRPLWLEVTDRHRFENRGRGTRQLIYRFDLMPGAAITGLEVTAGGRRHRAVAIDAAAAIRPLPEPTERADLALLREIGPDRYELTIYPIDPGTSVAASIAWTAPVALADSRVSARLPGRGGAGNLAATRVDVRTAGWGSIAGLDQLSLSGVRRRRLDVTDGAEVTLEARARFRRAGPLEVGLTAVELDRDLHALAITGVAGPGFRQLGRYLHVVLVVDVSASMGRDGIAAAARLADAILAQLPPETRVALVSFDREARRLGDGFAPNDHLIRGRVASALSVDHPRNGSDLGAALAEADTLLDTREVQQLTRDARVPGEPSAAIITISDQGTPLELTAPGARSRLGRFTLEESAFFAITIAREGRPFPRPLAGSLDDLVVRSGGASFAVRTAEAAARAPAIAKELGVSSELHSLEVRLGSGEVLDEVALPDRLAPGSGFIALVPWVGPVPSLELAARRRKNAVARNLKRRRDRALEAVTAPLLLGGLDPTLVARAHRYAESRGGPSAPLSPERDAVRQIARAGVRRPTVGAHLSLVIPSPADRFAAEHLAFARRWGSWLYRRAPTPAEATGLLEHRSRPNQVAPSPAVATTRGPRRGTIDPKTLRREIRSQLYRRIRGCYDRELRAAPRLRGSLTVRFEIADGETRAVDIAAGSIVRNDLRRCVIEASYRLKAPRAAGDHDTVYVVRYPFRFRVRDRRGEVSEDDGSGKAIELDPDDPLGGID